MAWTTWVAAIPGFLALTVTVFLPGTISLLLLGFRPLTALAAGPAISSAILGLTAIWYGATGIPWRLLSVGLATLLVWAVCLAVRLLTSPANSVIGSYLHIGRQLRYANRPHRPFYRLHNGWHRDLFVFAGAIIAFAVIAPLLMSAIHEPQALLRSWWDALFHLNSVQAIRRFGNASSFGGLDSMWGQPAPSRYYPAIWHSIAAVTPLTGSIPAAANLLIFVLTGVWLLGIAALAREVFPHRPEVSLLAPILALATGVFPTGAFGLFAQYPYGAAVAIIPGALALAYPLFHRYHRSHHLHRHRNTGLRIAISVIALLGAILMHPSAIGVWLVFAIPLAVGSLIRAFRTARLAGGGAIQRLTFFTVLAVSLLSVSVIVAFSTSTTLQNVINFGVATGQPLSDSVRNVLQGFTQIWPMEQQPWRLLVLLVFVAIGAIALLVRRKNSWLLAALLIVCALYVIAYSLPGSPLGILAGIWYTDSTRIAALFAIPAGILSAYGVVTLTRGLIRIAENYRKAPLAKAVKRTLTSIVASVIVGLMFLTSNGLNIPAITGNFRFQYQLAHHDLTIAENVLLWNLPAIIPEDSVIIGNPINGSGWAYAVANIGVVFPMRPIGGGETRELLASRFNRIHVDPRICEAVRELGITHFWSDDAPLLLEAMDSNWDGLRHVDTSVGFQPVFDADGTMIYQITACD